MSKQDKVYSDFLHVYKVVISCDTYDQLAIAIKLKDIYIRNHKNERSKKWYTEITFKQIIERIEIGIRVTRLGLGLKPHMTRIVRGK